MVPIYCNWCLQKNNTSAIQKSEKKRQKGTLDLHLPKKQVPAPRPISSLHPPAWNPRWWTPRDFWLRPGPGQTADSMILGSGEVEAFRKIITTSKWSEVTLTLATLDISVVIQHDSITISLNKKKLCVFSCSHHNKETPWCSNQPHSHTPGGLRGCWSPGEKSTPRLGDSRCHKIGREKHGFFYWIYPPGN